MSGKKRIGITIGDPAGIGPEIVLKALLNHSEIYDWCRPLIFAPVPAVERALDVLQSQTRIRVIRSPSEWSGIGKENREIIVCESQTFEPLPSYGQVSAQGGRMAFEAIRTAIDWANRKAIDAIATAPVNKQSLKAGEVPFTDHTAMFKALTQSQAVMTLFMTGPLRIFFYSRHIPFREIPASLKIENLVETMEQALGHLKKLGLLQPRLAVAALNPHGGENGLFGDEEQRIIAPAVEQARKQGWNVFGPIPADSVFHLNLTGEFDAVLSLYHDQGHIAAKTYDFYGTVSLTMGLPFLRTSVDHGTAFEIAGRNKANERSMVEAIKIAARYAW